MSERKINIAHLVSEPLGWGSAIDVFPVILDDYRWAAEEDTYVLKSHDITDQDIIDGRLTIDRYDVLLVPGGGVGDGECILRGIPYRHRTCRWKNAIREFVKNGGGYAGICGGTALITDLSTQPGTRPMTLFEQLYNNSSLSLSCAHSYYPHIANPFGFLSPPEYQGAISYVFSFAPGITKDGQYLLTGGVPIEYAIDKKHGFFKGYDKKTLRMRWWGGPALLVPDEPDRDVDVVARYPQHDLSENPDHAINAWRYKGGVLGLIKGFYRSINLPEDIPFNKRLLYAAYLAGDWEASDYVVNLDHQGKPGMTLETYPNEKEGRIILCTAHPEYMSWDGGHIEEEPNEHSTLASGHHRWHDITPPSKTLTQEFTSTWWVVRRMVAWSANVDSLPPIEPTPDSKKIQDLINEKVRWNGTLLHNIRMI